MPSACKVKIVSLHPCGMYIRKHVLDVMTRCNRSCGFGICSFSFL